MGRAVCFFLILTQCLFFKPHVTEDALSPSSIFMATEQISSIQKIHTSLMVESALFVLPFLAYFYLWELFQSRSNAIPVFDQLDLIGTFITFGVLPFLSIALAILVIFPLWVLLAALPHWDGISKNHLDWLENKLFSFTLKRVGIYGVMIGLGKAIHPFLALIPFFSFLLYEYRKDFLFSQKKPHYKIFIRYNITLDQSL